MCHIRQWRVTCNVPLTQGGWRHKRTTTAIVNSLLYSLSKHDVDTIADTFPELKHKLADHAEDYEKTNVTTDVQTGVAAAVRASKMTEDVHADTDTGQQNDPLNKVHDHLQQQDGYTLSSKDKDNFEASASAKENTLVKAHAYSKQ